MTVPETKEEIPSTDNAVSSAAVTAEASVAVTDEASAAVTDEASAAATDGAASTAVADDDDKIRGPVCLQFISSFISNIFASALEKFFNAVIVIFASHSFFPKRVHALMDSSEIQSTERCVGCGKVSKEKAPELRLRQNRIRKV